MAAPSRLDFFELENFGFPDGLELEQRVVAFQNAVALLAVGALLCEAPARRSGLSSCARDAVAIAKCLQFRFFEHLRAEHPFHITVSDVEDVGGVFFALPAASQQIEQFVGRRAFGGLCGCRLGVWRERRGRCRRGRRVFASRKGDEG